MEGYPSYQQQPQHHPQPHLQGQYPQQNGATGITSPNQQSIHHPPSQTSPLLPQQGNPYAQPGAPTTGAHHHPAMQYAPAGYPMPGPIPAYQMNATQAQAMATAAASGQHYYAMPGGGMAMQDQKMNPQTRRSPPQGVQQLPQRRMSQHMAGSPVVQPPQPVMNSVPRPSTAPSMPPPSAVQQHQQSPDVVAGTAEEAPLYVNAKQFHRILKRRLARQKLEEQLRLTSKTRKPYLHESRHNHAMRRPRGPGGRFLTSDEVAEMERKAAAQNKGEGVEELDNNKDGSKASQAAAPGSAGKRKAVTAPTSAQKKAKNNSSSMAVKHPDEDLEEEDEDDDDDGNDDG